MNNPSCKQKTVSCNHKMFNTGLTVDSSGLKPSLLAVCRCKRKCFKKFSESRTREVYETFWQVDDSTKRKKWVMEHVQKVDMKQWKRKRKLETRNYFLTDERGQRLKVCAGYFQRVLGFPDGSLLEPLMGHIDHHCLVDPLQNIGPAAALHKDSVSLSSSLCDIDHQHHHLADSLQRDAVILAHQKDYVSFSSSTGSLHQNHNLHLANPVQNTAPVAAQHKDCVSGSIDQHHHHCPADLSQNAASFAAHPEDCVSLSISLGNIDHQHHPHLADLVQSIGPTAAQHKDSVSGNFDCQHHPHLANLVQTIGPAAAKHKESVSGNFDCQHHPHLADLVQTAGCIKASQKDPSSLETFPCNDDRDVNGEFCKIGERQARQSFGIFSGNIHYHSHQADPLQKDSFLAAHLKDSVSLYTFPGNIDAEVDGGICKKGQNQDGSKDGSDREINISVAGNIDADVDGGFCKRGQSHDGSNDGSDGDIDISIAGSGIQNVDSSLYTNNGDSSHRSCEDNVEKDQIRKPLRGDTKYVKKESTQRSINICCVSSKDKNKDKTGRSIRLDDSRKRNKRKITSKDRTVSNRQISSSRNTDETDQSLICDADIGNSGKAKSSQRKSTSKDRTVRNRQISSSRNKNETDYGLSFDADIDNSEKTKSSKRSTSNDRAARDGQISSSSNKDETVLSLIVDTGKSKVISTCRTISGDEMSDSGNKKRIKDIWEKVSCDSRKRDLRRTAVCDRTVSKQDNISVGSEKRINDGLILDKNSGDSRWSSSSSLVSDDEYESKRRQRVSLVSGDGPESKRRQRVSLVSGDGDESKMPKRRQRSYLIGGDRFESEIPEKRRRSTRTTRMKGSMAEENLLTIDVEATDTLDSGSAREDLIPDEHEDLGCSKMELKLHANPKIRAMQSLNKSEMLPRPRLIIRIQDNTNICSYKQEINELSPQLSLPASRSRHHPRNKDGASTGEKGNASGHIIRKKTRKANNTEQLKNSNKGTIGSKHCSNKVLKLSTIKKKHKHPMLPSCQCSRRRCIENIPEERRRTIHHQFWNLSSSKDRKRWLVKFVEKRERKNKVLSLFPQRKNESKRYFLPDAKNEVVEVCRLFFIHTLGFRWDSMVDAAVRAKISSRDVGYSRHQLMKLRRELPEYVVESVTGYLISVRNSCTVTNKASVNDDVRMMFDVGRTSEGSHEIVSRDDKFQDLPRLKIKDIFKNWKINHKDLKFNLGYQSFRRIFQSVVDPVPVGQVEVGKFSQSMDTKDVDSVPVGQLEVGKVNQNINTKDVDSAACSDVGYSLPSKILCSQPGNTDHQNNTTESFSEKEPEELKSGTNLKGSGQTESHLNSDLTISTKSESVKLIVNRKSICQDDEFIDLKNGRELQENLANNNENYILDVGSGFFRQADADTINTDNSYSEETRYKKRQSLSTRNDRNNYPVLPPCKCRKRKCVEKFTESQRKDINTMFWDLGCYNERKQWILEHITRTDIKRRIVFSEGTYRKLESRWYYLPGANGSKVDVCKAFFLRTLGYRWDSVIDTIGKTTPKGVQQAALDKRGRKPPPHKISDEAVASMALYIENICNTYQHVEYKINQDHTKRFDPIPRGQNPLGLTMKQLFEDYKCKHPNHKFGYESFRKVFRRVHGDNGTLLPPKVDANDKPEKLQPKTTVLDDKSDSFKKDKPVGKHCLVENSYPLDSNFSVTKDYQVGKDCFDKEGYLVDKNYVVRKDCSAEDYYLGDTDCSQRNDYTVSKDCLVQEIYSADKEATKEGSYSSFRSENSRFGQTAVSFSETNLQTFPQPPAVPLPPPQATTSSHPSTTQQHHIGSRALEHTSCLYQAHSVSLDSQHQLPVMQVPNRVESLASDPFHSTVTDLPMMYHRNLYRPPTGVSGHLTLGVSSKLTPVVSGHLTRSMPGQLTPALSGHLTPGMSGHLTHIADHLGHSSGVNPHTNIDSANCRTQNQFPPYFVPNPDPLRYHVASQYQSILHHIKGSSRFFSYAHQPDNTFHEPPENQTFAIKQDFHRNHMNPYNIEKTAYGYLNDPASTQVQNPSHIHPMHFNVEQENTTTISSPYSDGTDSFVQDQQDISCTANVQGLSIPNFNNNSPCTKESKESTSKDNTRTKKNKSEKKKVEKGIRMKPKSLRNYREHYPMLATCNCKKKKCNEKFSEEARQKLHDNFWDLTDYNERKQWMLQHIKREDCRRRRIDQFESFRKLESRWYFFPDEEGNQQEVCKDFFLRTLGYKWDSVIDTIRRTTPKGETTTRPDQRGRKAPAHKLSSSVLRSVVQYIKSMQQVSQPLNEYDKNVEDSNCEKSNENTIGKSGGETAVPYGLTMKDLFDDYKAKHVGHKIGYESFRRIFRDPSKSEKIVFNDRTSEDEFLNLNNEDGLGF